MTTITIILFIISFALLNFSLISIFYHNKFTNDTTYFILSNSIILVSILLFYHYFNDYYLSLIFSVFYFINNICLAIELKKVSIKYFFFSIPYLLFNVYFLSLLIFKILWNISFKIHFFFSNRMNKFHTIRM